MFLRTMLLFCCPFLLFACRYDYPEPAISLEEFHLSDSFRIECIAAEPFVIAPVAMAFDERYRLWVVEMTGYMPNLDGTGEEGPTGKIVILEDRDRDGAVDHRKVFLDSLVLPRAMALVYGGVLYAEPPNLWFVEIENDRPGRRTLVDSLYAESGNVEHQPNGLLWNLDNWIYSAKSDVRYRRRNGVWEKQPTFFRGQWGITCDEQGRLFYNDNSNQLQGDFLPPNLLERNPAWSPRFGLGQQICEDQRVYPLHATSVNRGYQDGMLDEQGRLVNFTSACGPVIYSGDQFPAEYSGNALVCGPEANLIKRNIVRVEENGSITAVQAWQGREFLASTDETFRPVNLYNGPDGALYVLDMRRGIIQHKTYLTSYLREQLERKGLDTVNWKGRIYRISYIGKRLHPPPKFPSLKTIFSEKSIYGLNGWQRCRRQQFLVENRVVEAAPVLEKIVETSGNTVAVLHALWTLEGLGLLKSSTLEKAMASEESRVVEAAVYLAVLSESLDRPPPVSVFQKLAERKIPGIDLALCTTAGKFENEEAFPLLTSLLERHAGDTLFSEVVISGLAGKEERYLSFLKKNKRNLQPIQWILIEAIATKKQAANQKPQNFYSDELTKGLKLYKVHCSGCHRPGGEGIPNVAPPLVNAETVNGGREKIVQVILHGLDRPVILNGRPVRFNNAMPAFKDNDQLSQKDIEAIAAYVQNAFGSLQ